ncbi:TPA: hypothetical protein DIC20_01585 [Candidatus Dependentiae bacterium]|nr:MAG: hypothetical protein US03_C0008G0017 [candidate division TM6 bacterium GW2011_GWF2_36_131]KKQ02948.1 MAG: hypothetical protein US13_C0008G0021 [candidate division TM6 bacterium GW2011_GWE2_36_25]KKQ19683.1 MAG: hypothetical protein US32_C0006G0017 [candidate division TM6 bacterium GW2011_GWA2_36_9]HBR70945.1 hypothetical protein [Candidatus Dependentiae bacterium]HCU00378.1 hypothetical protein [Candidatus Dependentiae bacterium]
MKKVFLPIISLVLYSTCFSMDQKITEPYTLGWSARHHKIAKILTLGLYNPTYLDKLLADPLASLLYGYEVDKKFKNALLTEKKIEDKPVGEWRHIIGETINDLKKEAPLFLLGECTCEDWGPCILSRSFDPHCRSAYEEDIVHALLERLKSGPAHYVGFGTGGMFQDFLIILKTLIQSPDASLSIHLIDHKHTPYVAAREFIGDGREINPYSHIDPSLVLEKLKEKAKEEWGGARFKDDVIEGELTSECLIIEERTKQFITYLEQTFPHATLQLFIHNNVDSYLSFIKENHLTPPDVITAVDIQDEMSYLANGPYEYGCLCYHSLMLNPDSYNCWLAKWENPSHRGKMSKGFIKNRLDSQTDSIESNIEIDGETHKMYAQRIEF